MASQRFHGKRHTNAALDSDMTKIFTGVLQRLKKPSFDAVQAIWRTQVNTTAKRGMQFITYDGLEVHAQHGTQKVFQ